MSIRIDQVVYNHVRTKSNYSRYIESLIKEDMQMQMQKPIYQAVTREMLQDKEFLALLKQKLNQAGPVVKKIDDDVQLVQGDWGA